MAFEKNKNFLVNLQDHLQGSSTFCAILPHPTCNLLQPAPLVCNIYKKHKQKDSFLQNISLTLDQNWVKHLSRQYNIISSRKYIS